MATESIGDNVEVMNQEAFNHLAQGKRHLMVKDYFEAVSSLALACEYLAKIYGDSANECGEAYLNYGKALLELARTENGVLGMEDKPESEKEESEEDGDSAVVKEGGEKPASSSESKVEENGTSIKSNGDAQSSGSNGKEAESDTGETVANGVDEEGDEDEQDEDDIPNLNLAWEILELAKVIYQRQAEGDEAMEVKLAEVHLKLGEVSLETENYLEATKDMAICLTLQMKNLPPDDRLIAETYYQIGIAHSLGNQFDESIEAFANCGKLLEQRISNLKDKIKEGIKPDGDNPFYSFQGEIEELEQLFPAIKEKIFDMQDFKNETMKALLMSQKPDASDPGAGSSKDPAPSISSTSDVKPSSDVKPISNISHLVRKKRKSESEEPEAGQTKKPCTSEEVASSVNNAEKEL